MPNSEERPLLTFALFAYNQERFIADAVRGALNQTYTPLEIILSDDCSSDRTFEIMQELAAGYQGPNRVIVRRNERNLGLIGHINKVMEEIKGELIVAAAGDDISFPNRVECICQEYLASNRQAYSIFSNAIWIDENGRKMNLLRTRIIDSKDLEIESYASRATPGFINGATHAWRREAFDFFGPLAEGIGAEDTVVPFRSALLGKIRYIHEPLVLYRRNATRLRSGGDGNLSYSKFRNNWFRQKKQHLAIYQSRLRDIERYSEGKYGRMTDLDGKVKAITKSRIDELKNLIEISQSNLQEIVLLLLRQKRINSLFDILKTIMIAVLFPLINFFVLLAYFQYQNLHKKII